MQLGGGADDASLPGERVDEDQVAELQPAVEEPRDLHATTLSTSAGDGAGDPGPYGTGSGPVLRCPWTGSKPVPVPVDGQWAGTSAHGQAVSRYQWPWTRSEPVPIPMDRQQAGTGARSARPGRPSYPTAFAAARPAARPENMQPPRKVPSSER
ncbi:hypothetical protein GCM10010433_10640 [Streptomyces pulveraceus]